MKIRQTYVIFLTFTIVLCSLALQAFQATKSKLVKYLIFKHHETVYADRCFATITRKTNFTSIIITSFIGLWIPMIIVIVVHVSMFSELQKQARVRVQSSNSAGDQMQQILKLFAATVLAFFICSLPLSLMNCILYYEGNLFTFNKYAIFASLLHILTALSILIYTVKYI